MEIKRVRLVYFSPTGTTKKVLQGMAQGMTGVEVAHLDLTPPTAAQADPVPLADELLILGAPVYGGRLPAEAIKRFQRLKAQGNLAVVVVLYGNREFEDSLLEFRDLATELGCRPVAGGAFVGEHSFATAQRPVANGRPDDQDLRVAQEFGAKVQAKVAALSPAEELGEVAIPGRFPYEGGPQAMTVSPVTKEDLCILCGTCAAVCPTAAVTVDDAVTTQVGLCIRCTACVKNCPTEARVWEDEMMDTITNWLHTNCQARKEPKLFGVDA